MPGELEDLLPMFVAEARERLDRLAAVAAEVAQDETAAGQARRELHTIKGAARMLALSPLADLCHQAEDALRSVDEHSGERLIQVVDALAAQLDALQRGCDPAATHPSSTPELSVPAVSRATDGAVPSVHHGSFNLDSLAERAARLRILAVAAQDLVGRVDDLARHASRALTEPHQEHGLALLAASLRGLAVEMEAGQRRLRRLAEAQLDALLELQLQPLQPFLLRLARHARELAASLGKVIEVSVAGGDTRLDRRIVRELEEVLLHLVRNAVDHGAQPPTERQERGRPPATRIHLAAQAMGRRVRLTVSDDGAGIQPHKVAQAAVQRGALDAAAAAALTEEQSLRLLFLPGLSTREEVTAVSGRGVGLDVVSTVVARLGGEVTLASTPGEGTTFTVEVPAARRGEPVVVLRTAHLKVAVPAGGVRNCHWLRPEQIIERAGRFYALLGGAPLPFVSLAQLFGFPPVNEHLLVSGVVAGEEVVMTADTLEGEVEVLIRPLPRWAGAHPDFVDGVALLPSGEPVAVLAPLRLMHSAATRVSAPLPTAPPARTVRVLLVDDSFVTREMERRLLEDAGFEVVTAASGEEALTHLGESPVDCLVTDVEMPGMDGFALTRQVRGMPSFAHLPIVVVSTRDRPEDRSAGLQAGADAYMTKQALDATELVKLVRRLARP